MLEETKKREFLANRNNQINTLLDCERYRLFLFQFHSSTSQ